jgi:hypothetical protein
MDSLGCTCVGCVGSAETRLVEQHHAAAQHGMDSAALQLA